MILFSEGLVSQQIVVDHVFVQQPTSLKRYDFFESGMQRPLTILKFKNGEARVRMVPLVDASTEVQQLIETAAGQWQCAARQRGALTGTVIILASGVNTAKRSLLVLKKLSDKNITKCTPMPVSSLDRDSLLDDVIDFLPVSGIVRLRMFTDTCQSIPEGAQLISEKKYVQVYQDNKKIYKLYTKETEFEKALQWYSTAQKWTRLVLESSICFQPTQNQYVITLQRSDGTARQTARLKKDVPSAMHLVKGAVR